MYLASWLDKGHGWFSTSSAGFASSVFPHEECMTTPSFCLIEEPWIPVRTLGGAGRLVGLRQAFAEAADLQGVSSAHPLHNLAIHRLLLAIAHRAFGHGDVAARADLADAWPAKRAAAYLGQWSDRFDLFDAARPFLQVPALRDAQLERRPWTLIALERSSGNAKTLFDHSLDSTPGKISPVEAARHLLACLQFTNGGLTKAFRTSATRGPASGLACVLAEGDSLAETLALNLVPQSRGDHGKDVPTWERDAPPDLSVLKLGGAALPLGHAQRYAWQSRSILLLPEPEGVQSVLFAEGIDLEDGPVPDPMAALVQGKEALHPLRLSESRALWRDLHALAASAGAHPPATLETAIAVRTELGRSTRTLRIVCGGLLTDKAKRVLWRIEGHRIPGAVLAAGTAASAALRPAADRADEVGRGLHFAVQDLSRAWLEGASGRDADKAAVAAAAEALQVVPAFWHALATPYWQFVDRLGQATDPDEALIAWEVEVLREARRAWESATLRLGQRARALSAAARVGPSLARTLKPKFTVSVEK
jgi:CRISPR system Cascade subunit CasA